MTYCVVLNDHVLQEESIWYIGCDPLIALATILRLQEDQNPTYSVKLEKITTQKEEKRERRIKARTVVDPKPCGFTEVKEEYPY